MADFHLGPAVLAFVAGWALAEGVRNRAKLRRVKCALVETAKVLTAVSGYTDEEPRQRANRIGVAAIRIAELASKL